VKDADITNEGCPVAQPRLRSLPSANKIIECPSSNVYLSTCGLIFVLLIPGYLVSPKRSI